jgi:excisionase family DNA binding protein
MNTVSIENINVDELRALISECIRAEIKTTLGNTRENERDELISIKEVCEVFKVSEVTIHKWKRKGLIPFHKVNRKLYFKRSEILRCIEQDTKHRFKL